MLQTCVSLVHRNLWPLLTAHAIADAAVFLLHRISHRATNEAAVAFLLGGALSPAAIGNMWWLSVDPQLANFQTGYQPLTFVFFLLTFPVVVGVKSWAALATILFCQQAGKGEQEDGASIGSLWGRMFLVELLVASAVVPLTFASLAVVTIPLTLPLILDLQGAGPAAAVEGVSGMAAVDRSRALLRSIRWQLAIPFVGLVAARRLLEAAKSTLVNAMPPRFYQELIEIPLVVLVGGTVLSLLVARLQDVLPFVAYTEAASLETCSTAAVDAAQDGSGAPADEASPA
ncbi:hypothetical protein CHLNCDRAFT_140505 [Chlorella variabilis]|uniref:Uncharacterized protein n=1 Tax=Chlorella variabilis TaxID=554065 RepID=E1Z5J1_CHLVA|nr:hypothetical protein CHLNCDRAFT_140505 [Chlorella variabilis]EFN58483.1 hypothetical protein CHLNCDRAFT_140505 [Chlorella variabilis]|eukprot:XP_005850585.1 hypothetical protein CHLNCDRAFT_140505 [Chlorella variabilis]